MKNIKDVTQDKNKEMYINDEEREEGRNYEEHTIKLDNDNIEIISDINENNGLKRNEDKSNLDSNVVVVHVNKCLRCGLLEEKNPKKTSTNFETDSTEKLGITSIEELDFRQLIKELNLNNTKSLSSAKVIIINNGSAKIQKIKLEQGTGDEIKTKDCSGIIISSKHFDKNDDSDFTCTENKSSLISLASWTDSQNESESDSIILEEWERDSSELSDRNDDLDDMCGIRLFGSLGDCGKIHPGSKSEQDIKPMLNAALGNSKESKNRNVKSDIVCSIKSKEIQNSEENESSGFSSHNFSSKIELCSQKEIKAIESQNINNKLKFVYREMYRLMKELKKKDEELANVNEELRKFKMNEKKVTTSDHSEYHKM
ncbi:uncharacterized protein LOC111626214 [Centruroides sculpturatus]|uniref:uncharacterized protein LOC111626214 n=1 Tax=Centruroides sculpturatus TaxID=218467 RepID=UPI000C6E2D68|nr:uncharacterized protein LOC111626214 [Centruroides sculpturatus]